MVVDDGSTDDSADVAERFAEVRVLRRRHEGVAATRNAGLRAATGSLIGFCDSDDKWMPEKARVEVEYLDAHVECGILLCRQDTIFEPGVPAPTWLRPDQVRGDLDGVSPTSGMFRRQVFERLGGFRTDMDMGAEFDLLFRARAAGICISLIDQSLRFRRIHDDNMTTRFGGGKADLFRAVRDHVRARS